MEGLELQDGGELLRAAQFLRDHVGRNLGCEREGKSHKGRIVTRGGPVATRPPRPRKGIDRNPAIKRANPGRSSSWKKNKRAAQDRLGQDPAPLCFVSA